MDIVIVGAGMPFGPQTLQFKSLGGSETAQLMLGKELARLGHRVVQVTNLPAIGQPDFISPGSTGPDGVRYMPVDAWQGAICTVPHDLLIISRNMQFAAAPHQAKHAVFWAHDLATHNFMVPALASGAWNINEIWAVSNWHADQIHAQTGYPRDRIITMRNGIVDVNDIETVGEEVIQAAVHPRDPNLLVYAARPERGLEALLRPGGIMEQLPEKRLVFAMYDHFPEHMKPLYDWCIQRSKEMPNVEYLGSLGQRQLRRLIGRAAAYVYPTMFEETSCILARECIEQGTPFLTTRVGALPETLGDCGVFLEDFTIDHFPNRASRDPLPWNSDEFCRQFAAMVNWITEPERGRLMRDQVKAAMANRNDLYWREVAEKAISRAQFNNATKSVRDFSFIKSLVEDGDAIAALYLIDQIEKYGIKLRDAEKKYFEYLRQVYHFVDFNDVEMGQYYEAATRHWTDKYPGQHQADPVHDGMWRMERHAAVRAHLKDSGLAPGSTVVEYGIAEGNLILNLARVFPEYYFYGLDFDELALEKAREYAKKHGIDNFRCFNILDPNQHVPQADYMICTEVLEHVRHPDRHLVKLENMTKVGAPVILSTPFGAWEAMQWSEFGHDYYRQHIWEFSEDDFKEMLANRNGVNVAQVSAYPSRDGRVKGHRVATFLAGREKDNGPILPIRLDRKIRAHHPRQTVTACIITKDAGNVIPNLLSTLWKQVDAVQIALGPSQDDTRYRIQDFAMKYPWIPVTIVDVPAIEPGKFGFDDARNASIKDISTDWFLWIDSDEYLAGDIRKYLRDSAQDSYAIHQHHFTVEPRGTPAQIDRPARLCRYTFKFFGKIHEHAEIGFNQGPGYSSIIGDVDIGHTGYVNEQVRRARFERNFPFLVWDREVNPGRQLGPYLWFRDILHRMRYAQEAGNHALATQIAHEAIEFYKENVDRIIKFGAGAPSALAYFSEAMRYLGRGRDVKMMIALDGSPVEIHGQIDDYAQIEVLVKQMLEPEITKSRSPYWR